jgi:hypothetical protein
MDRYFTDCKNENMIFTTEGKYIRTKFIDLESFASKN